MLVFLLENGQELIVDEDNLEAVVLAVASGKVSKAELTVWLREQLPAG